MVEPGVFVRDGADIPRKGVKGGGPVGRWEDKLRIKLYGLAGGRAGRGSCSFYSRRVTRKKEKKTRRFFTCLCAGKRARSAVLLAAKPVARTRKNCGINSPTLLECFAGMHKASFEKSIIIDTDAVHGAI